jgi:phage shock protein PspC (stress-responsive transcriptional regulator)
MKPTPVGEKLAPMNTTNVHGTFREMWETRPARPRDDRQIAGVAAAIARRYDIDPVLVRVGFVVAAFFGIGAALYIAGWIVLPDTPENPAVPEGRRRGIFVVGLVIATIVSIGSVFGGRGGFILPLLAAVVLLFLLHRSRADRGVAGPQPGQSWPPQPEQGTGGVSLVKGVSKDGPADEQKPPSWDPLGAAPFAWDLPEPGPATPPPPPRRRRPVTLVTLGVALLAAAGTGVVLLSTGAAGLATFPILLGVVAAVLGLGLVVGSFLGAGRGLIPFALLVSALIWGALSVPFHRFGPSDGFGDLRAAPTTVAQLQPDYRRGAGDVTLDLRGLDLSGTGDARTSINVGAGDAEVLLPANADVTFTGESGLGDVKFDGRKNDGPGARMSVTDLGADGLRSGKLLTIDVHAGAGDVEVDRG